MRNILKLETENIQIHELSGSEFNCQEAKQFTSFGFLLGRALIPIVIIRTPDKFLLQT